MTEFADRFNQVLAPVAAYDSDIRIVASDGVWVEDDAGKRYLDFACGISVTNLGHQHPGVKAAVLEQIDQLWHAGGSFKYESKVRAAEALESVTPDGIDQFLFMNSGAEAVEASVKLARKTSGRQGVIVFRGGFHGRTMGSVTYTTSKAKYRQGYHPLVPSVFVTPFPHPFAWQMDQKDADERAIDDLRRMFRHEVLPSEVAAFLVEPVQGEGGYYPASPGFLAELRRMADEHGILLILDEVQTGFGRTGDWFASDVLGVRPDILVLGKAIANGFPLSAVGASRDLYAEWPPGSHGTTFGGNPVACAAAAATIEGLRDVVPTVGPLSVHAFDRFEAMAEEHETIRDVRGLGLMIGVEMAFEDGSPNPEALAFIRSYAQEHGMFILACGPDANVIRFIPPLVVTTEELDRGLDILEAGLAAYEAQH
jgi:4-aminobutyrate aminotransferase